MSLFDDGDGFGFLHNHRGEEETDSSSSSSEEEGEVEVEEDEQPCTHFGIIDSFEEPQSPAIAALDSPTESQEGQETEDCDNRQQSPWRDSKAKQRIINELKDENSAIHSMEFNEVHEKFAPQYQLKNFKPNFKRLVGNLEAKTGPFAEAKQQDAEEEEHTVEKWWTQGSISKGYSLLYNLYMEPEGTGIENMPVRTLWQSHAAFRL